MKTLRQQHVWLTGASMGIGRAVALELARRGARCTLTARSEAPLNELRDEIEQMGGEASVQPGDVTDAESMKSIVRAAESELGPVDMLIANAGTHVESIPEEFDTAEYMRLMNINYGGMLHCIEAALPGMLERQAGHIVGMASLAGLRGMPSAAAYSASKGAMINFLQSMHCHVAPKGICVTTINPGFVRTPLTDKNEFQMPFLMEADRAANVICNGLERRKKELSFPIPFSWVMRFLRITPRFFYDWTMSHVWRRMNDH